MIAIPAPQKSSRFTDGMMLLNSRQPLEKKDTEDENMKVLRLLNDVKKLQKKWKGKL